MLNYAISDILGFVFFFFFFIGVHILKKNLLMFYVMGIYSYMHQFITRKWAWFILRCVQSLAALLGGAVFINAQITTKRNSKN